jgi:hypothetical protein
VSLSLSLTLFPQGSTLPANNNNNNQKKFHATRTHTHTQHSRQPFSHPTKTSSSSSSLSRVWITNQHAATHSETVVWVVSNNTSAMSFSSHPARNDNFTFLNFWFRWMEKSEQEKFVRFPFFVCCFAFLALHGGCCCCCCCRGNRMKHGPRSTRAQRRLN